MTNTTDEPMTDADMIEHLDGNRNFGTPGSRYGSTTRQCAPVAIAYAQLLAEYNGEPITTDLLDSVMSMVVNDDPAIADELKDRWS